MESILMRCVVISAALVILIVKETASFPTNHTQDLWSYPYVVVYGFDCPFPYGDFVDPKDCSMYYECLARTTVRHHRCDDGQLFDRVKRQCAGRDSVDCNAKVADFPVKCIRMLELHADPEDCSKYYTCRMTYAKQKSCNSQELYDEHENKCQKANLVDCGSRFNPRDPRPTVTTVKDSTTTERVTDATTTKMATDSTTTEILTDASTTKMITDSTTTEILTDATTTKMITDSTTTEILTDVTTTKKATDSTTTEMLTDTTTTKIIPDSTTTEILTDATTTKMATDSTTSELLTDATTTKLITDSTTTEILTDATTTKRATDSTTTEILTDATTTKITPDSTTTEILTDATTTKMITDSTTTKILTDATTTKMITDTTTGMLTIATSSDEIILCPKANGLFSHPTNPNLFVNCYNFVATVQQCPDNLVFEPVIKRCDWPKK